MKDFEHYLGVANHDIQMANNQNELKEYVANLLYEYDRLQQELKKKQDIIDKIKEYFEFLKLNSIGGNKEFCEDIIKLIQMLEKRSGINEC